MRAALKTYRQSPRKVRLVADLIRGKKATDALVTLQFANKKAAQELSKLLKSAIANAKTQNLSETDLFVKEIQVNKGVTLKRIMPRARGSASAINKRTSHITISLGTKETK
ncbi:MAG TPA: 50S ribosomal protein L22 [Candidatus Paceibacterota bacterium]|nr:50S ribosomal protein L22 [Candidatus Paceibacterota bacterium]